MTTGQRTAKRAFDVAISFAGLVCLTPLLAAIGAAVRVDSPGPVLFCQRRIGRGGRLFTCYKFRTMQENAPDLRNADGSTYNSATDARVTRTGRLLRKTSLDELPQLLNVLKGDMSLVGPRPDLPDHMLHYSERDRRRLEVKPGLTGWASVHGRNALPWSVRRELDAEYVERYSLLLDLQILLRTIPLVLLGRGVNIPPEILDRLRDEEA